LYFAATLIVPPIVEKGRNKITTPPPYQASKQAMDVYNNLDFIADLHCDALLWDRDLTEKSDYGHVDFPRMQEANVALQAFTIVTKSPKGQNMHQNSADATDNITSLSIAQGQPVGTWFNLYDRAIYQCEKLHDFASDYDNMQLIKSKSDLTNFVSHRKTNPKAMAGFLGIEGAHCLEGDLENVDKLFNAGVRMMAATHFFDNKLGGSAHGISGEGLTDFGKQVIDRMDDLEMIIDLAHISPQMIEDILDRTTRPVIVSHIGVKAVLNSPRNLSDAQIKRIAANGGLIGIAFFPGAIGDEGVKGIVASMKHVKSLVGVKHVALGSDTDGSVTLPFDITGLPLIVEEMLKQGFTTSEIKAIMGENVKQFLLDNLPSS
ncbi:peptidase M19, partial [Fulvivirga sp. RKSG066]|uniref:dipeptidase n=1 Tax=Fulvivirga aurantia TaxID=2529383 RepID=UPI0012BC4D5E